MQLVYENNVKNVSSDLPGLIIQSYLVLVRLFDLDVMEPLGLENSTKEKLESAEENLVIDFEEEFNDTSKVSSTFEHQIKAWNSIH